MHERYHAFHCRDCNSFADPGADRAICRVTSSTVAASKPICPDGRKREGVTVIKTGYACMVDGCDHRMLDTPMAPEPEAHDRLEFVAGELLDPHDEDEPDVEPIAEELPDVPCDEPCQTAKDADALQRELDELTDCYMQQGRNILSLIQENKRLQKFGLRIDIAIAKNDAPYRERLIENAVCDARSWWPPRRNAAIKLLAELAKEA